MHTHIDRCELLHTPHLLGLSVFLMQHIVCECAVAWVRKTLYVHKRYECMVHALQMIALSKPSLYEILDHSKKQWHPFGVEQHTSALNQIFSY